MDRSGILKISRQVLVASVAIDFGLTTGMTLSNLFLPHVALEFLAILSIPFLASRFADVGGRLARLLVASTPLICAVLVAVAMKIGHPFTPNGMLMFMGLTVHQIVSQGLIGMQLTAMQPEFATTREKNRC